MRQSVDISYAPFLSLESNYFVFVVSVKISFLHIPVLTPSLVIRAHLALGAPCSTILGTPCSPHPWYSVLTSPSAPRAQLFLVLRAHPILGAPCSPPYSLLVHPTQVLGAHQTQVLRSNLPNRTCQLRDSVLTPVRH